jgi:hypothetical protein
MADAGTNLLSLLLDFRHAGPVTTKMLKDVMDAEEKAKKTKADEEKALKGVEEIKSREDQERAQLFHEAVELAGGGKAIVDRQEKIFTDKHGAFKGPKAKENRERFRRNIGRGLQDALEGNEAAVNSFIKGPTAIPELAAGYQKATEEKGKTKAEQAKRKAEQAAKQMADIDSELDKYNLEQFEKSQKVQEQEANRFSGSMAKGSIGQKFLMNPHGNFNNDIKAGLMASGKSSAEATILVPMVAEQIRKDLEQRIGEYIAKHPGKTNEEARAGILNEDRTREEKRQREASDKVDDARERVVRARDRVMEIRKGNSHAAFSGLTEFAKSTQVGALNQIDQQKELVAALKDSAKADRELKQAINDRENFLNAAP